MKTRYTRIRDWNNVVFLFHDNTLQQSMTEKQIDETKSGEMKKIYNHYLHKRKETMKKTSFRAEDVFDDVISKDSISSEQMSKPNNFLSKI